MNENQLINKVNEYLDIAKVELSNWLEKMLPKLTDEWWQKCVLDNLTSAQKKVAVNEEYEKLSQFDLQSLLRVTDKSWIDMKSFACLPSSDRVYIRDLMRVKNNWMSISESNIEKNAVLQDLRTILNFFECVIVTNKYTNELREMITTVEKSTYNTMDDEFDGVKSVNDIYEQSLYVEESEIRERDKVYLVGKPDTKGMVYAVLEVNGVKKYEVFVDGDISTFYEGQIRKVQMAPSFEWVDVDTFKSNLTAYEINNPSSGNLYSLNAARIDFVPYQFRPALKMIKSDEPRILIADSVGVGKTIEAGLIIKELEARNDLENILIICPKPLVAERKWEIEMRRFDEEFSQIDGPTLKQILSETHRDGEWPTKYNKAIIPYSILDGKVYNGDGQSGGRNYSLLDLDPAPHFDLVIIDEAHHIRNGSMEKEKAFAYKCVRYFCEHADAVVMLTATPLQTSDDDLFTLLNVLRPNLVIDKEVFGMMSEPNKYIYQCSHAIRGNDAGWEKIALEALRNIRETQWGANVIAKNPLYLDIIDRIGNSNITREERVKLISDVESLHSFNTMLNRTRRRDIQDFCVRRSYTVETAFTPKQAELHDELLRFEYEALTKIHDVRSILFMMTTIRRQAASCIFGLVPHIRDIIDRRFSQMIDDPEFDFDKLHLDNNAVNSLTVMAQNVINLADNLPEDDPKFDSVIKIIDEKQKAENNKIILFSTFRHTLRYLYRKFLQLNYRVAQIDGSVSDDERRELRGRFELDKADPNALDILLFTEVGSEGLDYQFCDTMINYDLPWNPMRIEQRIGRIDRRGQQSEVVNIYNIITPDTVDADIYERCLMRIGIFERSIGECEEVLGAIGTKIEQIAVNSGLTTEQRRRKLEQMADNEIRRMQELTKLEDEERALFGFDLSTYTTTKEIENAESPWLEPASIQKLVERYLDDRLGEGQYIVGNSNLKLLRLGKEARSKLLEDFRKLPNIKTGQNRKWESFLKGNEPKHSLTFYSEMASKENKAFFITPTHPIVKQAAKHFHQNKTAYLHLEYYSNSLIEGTYPFSIYAWNYVGMQPTFKVVPICENTEIAGEVLDLIQHGSSSGKKPNVSPDIWKGLEAIHINCWQKAKGKHQNDLKVNANFKLESISSNFKNRKRSLEQKIQNANDERIIRMHQSELKSAIENYNAKVEKINEQVSRADIHTNLVAHGIVEIKKG